jgi:hypothetical protein
VIKRPPPFFCLTHPRHITILSALGPNAPAEGWISGELAQEGPSGLGFEAW